MLSRVSLGVSRQLGINQGCRETMLPDSDQVLVQTLLNAAALALI